MKYAIIVVGLFGWITFGHAQYNRDAIAKNMRAVLPASAECAYKGISGNPTCEYNITNSSGEHSLLITAGELIDTGDTFGIRVRLSRRAQGPQNVPEATGIVDLMTKFVESLGFARQQTIDCVRSATPTKSTEMSNKQYIAHCSFYVFADGQQRYEVRAVPNNRF